MAGLPGEIDSQTFIHIILGKKIKMFYACPQAKAFKPQ
jgi:hypothetical protein